MRCLTMMVSLLALTLAVPDVAAAQQGTTTGALTGALTGGLVGGPIGAVIGGVAGAAIGGAAESGAEPEAYEVRRPAGGARVIQRTCVQDAAGNQTCRDMVR